MLADALWKSTIFRISSVLNQAMSAENPDHSQSSDTTGHVSAFDRSYRTFTRIGNLLLAAFFLLSAIGSEDHWRWAGSPPPLPDGPPTFRGILMGAITVIWFAGA